MTLLNPKILVPGNTVIINVPLPSEIWNSFIGDHLNAQINLSRVTAGRNEFIFQKGESILRGSHNIISDFLLHPNTPPGLYCLDNVRLLNERGECQHVINIPESERFFCILSIIEKIPNNDVNYIAELVARYGQERKKFLNAPEYANDDKKGESYRATILVSGCLIHGQQNIPGITITPLGIGFGYKEQLNAANLYLKRRLIKEIQFNPDKDRQSHNQTPVISIEYSNIIAENIDEAIRHAYKTTDFLLTVLAVDRGKKGTMFFWTVQKHGDSLWHTDFILPSYSGNLVGHFDLSQTGKFAEHVLKQSARSNWIRLLCESYALAVNEQDYGSMFLRQWTVIEMIAKKYIVKSNDNLKDMNGNDIVKNGKGHKAKADNSLGRVYKYLYEESLIPLNEIELQVFENYNANGVPNSQSNTKTEKLTQYQMLAGAYEIRNHIGHRGRYDPAYPDDPDKAKFAEIIYFSKAGLGLNHLESLIRSAVLREINNPIHQIN